MHGMPLWKRNMSRATEFSTRSFFCLLSQEESENLDDSVALANNRLIEALRSRFSTRNNGRYQWNRVSESESELRTSANHRSSLKGIHARRVCTRERVPRGFAAGILSAMQLTLGNDRCDRISTPNHWHSVNVSACNFEKINILRPYRNCQTTGIPIDVTVNSISFFKLANNGSFDLGLALIKDVTEVHSIQPFSDILCE